jgi:protein TilB
MYCRHLKIIYLQNNLISKIQNLHRLKELEYLNMAVNNITKIENLQRCESLTKLDFTMCFISKASLLTLQSLQGLYHLKEIYLTGNPCTEWDGYREYVIGTLPILKRLDGKDIKPSERIAAQQAFPTLHARLLQELIAEGIDPQEAARADNQEEDEDEDAEIAETGYWDEEKGEMMRPWCPETRILEHRENEAREKADEERKKAEMDKLVNDSGGPRKPPRREDFEEIKEGDIIRMKNEGEYDFSLEESEDGKNMVLEVDVGKFTDTSLIKADVQPTFVRLLIKGRLLQLTFPEEVSPDLSTAERSKASGKLVVTMPRVDSRAGNPMLAEPGAFRTRQQAKKKGLTTEELQARKRKGNQEIKEVRRATVVTAANDEDSDEVPDL